MAEDSDVGGDLEAILVEFGDNDDKDTSRKEDTTKGRGRKRTRILRRGGRNTGKTNKTSDIKLLQMNCDGYISKKASIEDIVKEKQTDILLLNETSLKGKRKVRLKNYFSFCKNRSKAKGGVATVVANYLQSNTVKVAEGREGDEYLITRLDHVTPAVNIMCHSVLSSAEYSGAARSSGLVLA